MEAQDRETFDVLVAGAGPAGLSAALVCARLGLRTCVLGRLETRALGRTVALLKGSLVFFDQLGVLDEIVARSAPLETMRVVDDTDTIFRAPAVAFAAAEINLPSFGRNIETPSLIRLLAERVSKEGNVILRDGMIDSYAFGGSVARARSGPTEIAARLVVAADGRKSVARRAAGIEAQTWTYPQWALTGLFAHDLPHEGASTEIHKSGGPFTLVPLPGDEEAPHRSSLVWMTHAWRARRLLRLSPAEFALEAEREAHSFLGKMRLVSPIGALPMSALRATRLSAPRLALVGEAAHGFPPIGAQGLNLGLRDVACLADLLASATDPGAPSLVEAFHVRRRADVALRTLAVDWTNRSLCVHSPLVDLARGFGLLALGNVGPMRRAAMRAGLGPGALPPARRPRLSPLT